MGCRGCRRTIGGGGGADAGRGSLAMHRVRVSFADGASARLVLRRFVRSDQIAEDPAVAEHEAALLELVERMAT